MAKYWFSLIFFGLCLAVIANDQIQPPIVQKIMPKAVAEGIEGYYQVNGSSAAGGKYSGMVNIIHPKDTKIYLMIMIVGKDVTKGVGVLQGDTLSVGWSDGPTQGVTVMKFVGNNASGIWSTVPGNGSLGHETWRFIAAPEKE